MDGHQAGQGRKEIEGGADRLHVVGPASDGRSLSPEITTVSAVCRDTDVPVFVAGGIGSAPFPALAKSLQGRVRIPWMLYGARTAADALAARLQPRSDTRFSLDRNSSDLLLVLLLPKIGKHLAALSTDTATEGVARVRWFAERFHETQPAGPSPASEKDGSP